MIGGVDVIFTVSSPVIGSLEISRASCPGLVPVPSIEPIFCIQPFEGVIDSNGQASSIRGQTPAVNVSLIDAMTACESTQIDGGGTATVQEWQDGDGVLGAGGTPYPGEV